jgi:methionine sulfoxide reductase heme-binding subunit
MTASILTASFTAASSLKAGFTAASSLTADLMSSGSSGSGAGAGAGAGSATASFLHGPALWFANRGTGFILLALLTLSTMLGVLSTTRVSPRLWPRMLSQGLHRNVSLLAVTFLAAHVATAVVDTFVDIRWWNAFVPFTGSYQPEWLGLGALALDLIIAVTVTSLLRHRMSHRPWRAVHVMAYAAWGLGLLHGLQIGTDAATAWGAGFTYGCIGAVLVSVALRLGLLSRPKTVTS